jgi:hypothetical protein
MQFHHLVESGPVITFASLVFSREHFFKLFPRFLKFSVRFQRAGQRFLGQRRILKSRALARCIQSFACLAVSKRNFRADHVRKRLRNRGPSFLRDLFH